MQPKVAILTINYNALKDTLEFLDSIKKLDYDNHETILVDNASKDNPEKVLSKRRDIKFVKSKENLGFTGGIKLAMKYAPKDTKYFLIVNNDIIVDKNLLKELVKVAEGDKEIGFVGGAIYDYYTRKLYSLGGKISFLTGLAFAIRPFTEIRELKKVNEYVDSCVLLVRKEVLDKIGGYDKVYFMYCETEDWIIRARKKGFRVFVNPNVRVWHKLYGGGGGKKSPFVVFYLTRNRFIFIRKNTSKINQIAFLIINFLIILPVQFLLFLVKGQFKLIPAFLKGIYRGVSEKVR